MTPHRWLFVRYLHFAPDGRLPEWQALALRDDGYDFYAGGLTKEVALEKLNRHLDDPPPAWDPAPPFALTADYSRIDGSVKEIPEKAKP